MRPQGGQADRTSAVGQLKLGWRRTEVRLPRLSLWGATLEWR